MQIRKALMTGVSYMLPFIVVAGMTIAMTGIITEYINAEIGWVLTLNEFAWTVMGFIAPIFAAYVAYAMAGKPGIAPGFIGGWIAVNPVLDSAEDSGFLGAVIAGLIAGYLVHYLKQIKMPEVIDSLRPTLIIPVIAGWVMYFVMAYPVGLVVGDLYSIIIDGLKSMQGTTFTAIILGGTLAAMCAFDMGGPVNKIAIAFVFAVWADPSGFGFEANAAVFPGIMAPGIALAAAAKIMPKKFTDSEIEQSPTALVSGLVGITEAALPYAFRDPVRVVGANVIGAFVGGAMMMSFSLSTPGVSGIVGIPPASNIPLFILSILVAVAISTGLLILFKKPVEEEWDSESKEDLKIELE
ncbi:MAG: PTS fructose transporter subunit IIC [Candidatus Izemoplasmataceae bacterium]